ncbi:precorrin-4 C(11)-methyltransferase [Diaphorobacter caeni]|uniref:precorrin-4 C(11)-methyltransferase n=1 Tax=Diaphorobacter caeni TaxID=2784387 RepID=UPI00188FE5B6|nr:precorrin-4 C(11)-methyltransferase [Diaphorobacter caeni]MBF5006290.1 precorrin-4 C(11)-methyltransferase [Diaphorobacter caeni]
MTVHFIGAGPGAADLITLRGRDLLAASPVCLYAGSLVPTELLAHCPPGARLVNTAPMSLEDIVSEMCAAHARGEDVARLHSGDLSIWSAMGEQLRSLRERHVPYTVTPGVPSFSAAAAALGAELTLPGSCQSVVLTRTSGRASSMPGGESLAAFAATGAVLAIHLSVHVAEQVQAELTTHYGPDCPAAIVWRASWPDETVVRTRVGEIAAAAQSNALQRSALILVGATLSQQDFGLSRLYANDYDRRYRPRGDEPRFPEGREDESV